jgi:hypothetical protein
MLEEIGTVDKVAEYVKKVKDKSQGIRLMGFGHRVYKNYDPRAKAMQIQAHAVLDELGLHDDPLLKVAMELEKVALSDPYFIEKKLYPNIDFYSGITLKALGFPTSMFTALFAGPHRGLDRAMEEMRRKTRTQKIGRPRQIYTGPAERAYVCRWRSGNNSLTMGGLDPPIHLSAYKRRLDGRLQGRPWRSFIFNKIQQHRAARGGASSPSPWQVAEFRHRLDLGCARAASLNSRSTAAAKFSGVARACRNSGTASLNGILIRVMWVTVIRNGQENVKLTPTL